MTKRRKSDRLPEKVMPLEVTSGGGTMLCEGESGADVMVSLKTGLAKKLTAQAKHAARVGSIRIATQLGESG